MEKTASRTIDFDRLRQLAQSDPEGFEVRRRELIEELIGQAPEWQQRRLRGLQWRVDVERERASNPLAACVALSRMMWEAVAGDGGLIDVINRNGQPQVEEQEKKACIVPLAPKRE